MLDKLPPEILGIIFNHVGPLTIEVLKSVSKRLKEVIEGLGVTGRILQSEGKIIISANDICNVVQISQLPGNKWLVISTTNILIYEPLHDSNVKFSQPFEVRGRGTFKPKKVVTHGSLFAYVRTCNHTIEVWDSETHQNVSVLKIGISYNHHHFDLAMSHNLIVLLIDNIVMIWRYRNIEGFHAEHPIWLRHMWSRGAFVKDCKLALNSSYLVTKGFENMMHKWDISNMEKLHQATPLYLEVEPRKTWNQFSLHKATNHLALLGSTVLRNVDFNYVIYNLDIVQNPLISNMLSFLWLGDKIIILGSTNDDGDEFAKFCLTDTRDETIECLLEVEPDCLPIHLGSSKAFQINENVWEVKTSDPAHGFMDPRGQTYKFAPELREMGVVVYNFL